MSTEGKLFVVVGSGPGIGVKTASQFASNGFNIALISRNAERLAQDKSKVESSSSSSHVSTYPVDVSNADALQSTLNQVNKELGPPEVVLFNAARIAQVAIGEASPDFLVEDFKTMTVGLYVTASWALPYLTSLAGQSGRHPSLFLSGGSIYKRPLASLFSLSLQKAAQYNFMESYKTVAGPKGVHVATVSIAGVVDDNDPVINASNIATTYWRLYQQDKNDWEFEVPIGDVDEQTRNFHSQGVY